MPLVVEFCTFVQISFRFRLASLFVDASADAWGDGPIPWESEPFAFYTKVYVRLLFFLARIFFFIFSNDTFRRIVFPGGHQLAF